MSRRSPVSHAAFEEIELYAGSATSAPVDLSDNTNRWGMPPAAQRAIAAAATRASRYPEPYALSLKEALGARLGMAADMITTGCGSDDVLDSAIRAFAGGNGSRSLVAMDPTFVMVGTFARVNGLALERVPLTPTYDCDAEMMCASASAITYICSPNNPTGTAVARRSVEELARRATGLVIIDEAYAEFADENLLDLARDRDNVLVVRTFSKAFGLAGVRVGYGVGAPALVREVEKARGPFKVSAVAMDAAVAALADDAWMRQHVALARENRDRLTHELRARSIDAIPSQANFVLAPLPDATRVARLMRQHGVAVRAFNGLPPIAPELARAGGEALRISVGPWAELETALAALDRARGMLA